jgi:hypothetical protein
VRRQRRAEPVTSDCTSRLPGTNSIDVNKKQVPTQFASGLRPLVIFANAQPVLMGAVEPGQDGIFGEDVGLLAGAETVTASAGTSAFITTVGSGAATEAAAAGVAADVTADVDTPPARLWPKLPDKCFGAKGQAGESDTRPL